jgi:hypothetical protein
MADELERRVSVLEQARKEIEDAMLVMAHLEKRQSERTREHAEWLAHHETAMTEITDKLNGLIDIVDRQQRGGGAPS